MANLRANHATRRAAAAAAPIALLGLLLAAALAPTASAATLLNVDITAQRQRANAVETWWVQFTTVTAVPSGGDIQIVFPAGFRASFGGASQCDVVAPASMVTENTTVVDDTTVVCGLGNATIDSNTPVRLSISNVRNPSTAGATAAFQIQTRNALDGTIDQHQSNTEEILPEQVDGLSKVDVRSHMQRTGALVDWTVSFTPTKMVPRGGNVRIVFPPGFALSMDPASECAWSSDGLGGANSTLVDAREIQCNLTAAQDIAAGRAVSLNVTGVRNPSTEQYTATFLIQTRDGTTVLDESTQNQELITAHSFFAGPVHRASSTQPGANASHRFEFILFNGWGGDGMFEITLPVGYRYNETGLVTPNLTFEYGGTGKFERQLFQGQNLIFKRVGGAPLFNGAHLLVRLDHVMNPSEQSVTDSFQLATLNASRLAHDRGVVSGVLIQSPSPTPTGTTSPTSSASSTPTPTTNGTGSPTNTTSPTTEPPIGPLDDDSGVSASPRGQGSPGLSFLPILGALLAAGLFVARRRSD